MDLILIIMISLDWKDLKGLGESGLQGGDSKTWIVVENYYDNDENEDNDNINDKKNNKKTDNENEYKNDKHAHLPGQQELQLLEVSLIMRMIMTLIMTMMRMMMILRMAMIRMLLLTFQDNKSDCCWQGV